MKKLQLQEAFKLALSVTLFYWLAMALQFPSPKNGAIAIAVTSMATVGDSWNKGLLRIFGTAVGVVAGLLILTVFAQSRWGFMLAMAVYVIAVSYALQNSRNGYAWFLAGMTAAIVWSSSYMVTTNAFQVGLFRFVETAGGVLVYTVVSLLLWPRSAGVQVDAAGRQILENLRDLFRLERANADGTAELRGSLAGSLPQFEKILAAASSDTSAIRQRKGIWKSLPADIRSVGDALQLCRLSTEDVRHLDRDRLLPGLGADLDAIEQRLEHVVQAWDGHDGAVPLAPLPFATEHTQSLSHADRARFMNHVHDLRRIDESSRALLKKVRVLARLEEPIVQRDRKPPRPSRWDPERLIAALFPALCFVVAFLLWIYTNPPAGNAIPILGIAFGMLLMLIPMNLFKVLKILLLGIAVMSLLYMFVLPRIDNGATLLALVFASTFLLGLLGGRLAILRTLGLICFALTTNITNRQSYSFLAVLYPAIMMFLGTGVVMTVYWFTTAMQPEKVAARSVRRFMRGCARIMQGLAANRPQEQSIRRRAFRFDILPAGQRLRIAQKSLDDAQSASVTRLIDAVQLMTFRLQSLDHVFDRATKHPVELGGALNDLRKTLERTFLQWSRSPEAPEKASLDHLSDALRDELDGLAADEETLSEFWAVLGGLRGLIETMDDTRDAMREIRWDEWAVARF